jgi:putative ABC transport system permease protein
MIRFYLAYALRSIARGGQRSVLALSCIAFAVLSLVSMQLLAGMVRAATVIPARAELGGDLSLSRNKPLNDDDVGELERLRASGSISAFTIVAPNPRLTMARRAGSGRIHFLSRTLGIEPQTYPLVGEVVVTSPAGESLAKALSEPGAVAVTRDVARRMRLSLGDTVFLGGPGGTAPVPLHVTAVVSVLPDRKGDTMLYDLATARLLAGQRALAASVGVRAREEAAQALTANGWNVRRASEVKPGSAAQVFDFMLKGAGLLGLMLGGIGVANTMTVSLARRDAELAVLKTVGYKRRDLLALLGCETALLALAGSLAGGLLAVPVAAQLMHLLDSTEGSLMLVYALDSRVVLLGVLAGTVTALVFGTYATMRAAAVRPALLLRQGALPPHHRSLRTLTLASACAAAVFGLLASAIMGSVARGMGVIGVGAIAIVLLGAMFGALLVAVLKLPIPGALLNLARRNLQHRRGRAIVAVIALFVGSFTVGFAASAMLTARGRYASKRGSAEGSNVRVFAPLAQEDAVRRALLAENSNAAVAVMAEVNTTDAAAKRLPYTVLEGRAELRSLRIVRGSPADADAGADADADAVYLPERAGGATIRLGDTILVRADAREARLVVAGFYAPPQDDWSFSARPIVSSAETARALAGARASLAATAALPVAQLDSAVERLSRALPSAMVLSKGDYNDLLVRAYTSLFMFVAGMSALAFLAGVVLIANAVGLALVERKRELGILKAIGYARKHVLATILIENAILGALAGATGVAAVQVVAAITNRRFFQARMHVGAPATFALLGFTIALALFTAAVVAWRPTRLRPLAVLRQE